MTTSKLVSIEERRYAALIQALKDALFALNIPPRYKVGLTDSYLSLSTALGVSRHRPVS